MRIESNANTTELDKLSVSFTKLRDLGQSEKVKSALVEAAQDITKQQKQLVKQRAKSHPRGQLEDAVKAGNPYSGAFGAVIKFGWEQKGVSGSKSKYRDSKGKRRSVSTVADYAAILEYSAKRKLRHLEEGFENGKEAATSRLESLLSAEVERLTR